MGVVLPFTQRAISAFGLERVKVELQMLPVDLLTAGRFKKRRRFTEKTLRDLAASLQQSGTNITPVIVRPGARGRYEILSGERRWRAALQAGLDSLQCLVGGYSDSQAKYIALVDNLQREELTPLEEAECYAEYGGYTHQDIADFFGKSRGHVTNYLRLLELDVQVKDALQDGRLSFAQARPLCGTETAVQRSFLALALKNGWSARQIQSALAKHAQREAELREKRRAYLDDLQQDPDLRRLQRLVSERTGTPCLIQKTPDGAWRMAFQSSTADEFSGLLQKLGIETSEV